MSGWHVGILVWLCSMLVTALVRRLILRRGWLDHPNERSSHVTPTPRGGGLAIASVVVVGNLLLLSSSSSAAALPWSLGLALVVGGALIALLGWIDDRHGLAAGRRLFLQAAIVLVALAAIGGLPPVRIGYSQYDCGWIGHLLTWPALIWFLNLYNFMDGIDGIAASEAVFVSFAAAWLTAISGAPMALTSVWVLVGTASLGFLPFNWAPARLFMGDVGSGFLGFVIGLLLVASGHVSGLSMWTAIILTAPFFADATVTLARRVARGERWYIAHRSHAYQRLARRWGSHARVTVLVILVNVLLVLPAAWYSVTRPAVAAATSLVVLSAMLVGAWLLGAGRPEARRDSPVDRVGEQGRDMA
jgi:Fuc2NAc and GlcNAc transferase